MTGVDMQRLNRLLATSRQRDRSPAIEDCEVIIAPKLQTRYPDASPVGADASRLQVVRSDWAALGRRNVGHATAERQPAVHPHNQLVVEIREPDVVRSRSLQRRGHLGEDRLGGNVRETTGEAGQ